MGWRGAVFQSARSRPIELLIAIALPRRATTGAAAARRRRARATLHLEQDRARLSVSLFLLDGRRAWHFQPWAMRGDAGMKAVFFYHAFASCWYNGQSQFMW